ncbi:hypothetical protein [Lichenibacterium dinghuense]|uniref:sulfotransferase-like domain-containing protein n=1 Tax=Lichenibacterium dinghuense TaxID=2895977 RepID=UPI001F44E36B|nr:hypothetical protein [Lichenibacterium sp. 6Y81]
MEGPLRIAMWSGPRNISTAMMRAFENRPDCAVSDEPFYAAYLAATGLVHPQRDEILASQPTDPAAVVAQVTGPSPGGSPLWYQKHMTHHMLAGFDRGWIDGVANAFLIRAPEAVLLSYVEKRTDVTLDEIGLPQQVELFDRVADRLGRAPPVVESRRVLLDPRGTLSGLCAALGIGFDEAMLRWPPGRRDTDGVWAPSWYDGVERSTGFAPPGPERGFDDLPDRLKPLAAAGRPLYERLAEHVLPSTP